MPFDPAAAERIRQALAKHQGITEKKMFGGLAFLLNGHMCCGLLKDQLVLRLGNQQAALALKKPHTKPMNFTGRPIRSMLYVVPQGYATRADLRYWLQLTIKFAQTLPVKKSRPRKKPPRSSSRKQTSSRKKNSA